MFNNDLMAVMLCKVCPSDTAEVEVEWGEKKITKLTFTCAVCGLVTEEDYDTPIDPSGIH